jgi:hypothetical protein
VIESGKRAHDGKAKEKSKAAGTFHRWHGVSDFLCGINQRITAILPLSLPAGIQRNLDDI